MEKTRKRSMIPEFLKNRKTYVLTAIVVTIIGVLSLSFAYFNAQNANGNLDNTIVVSTLNSGEVTTTFDHSDGIIQITNEEFNSDEESITKILKFAVTNSGSNNKNISINWSDLTNKTCNYATNNTCNNNESGRFVGDNLKYHLYECSLNNYNESTVNYNYSANCVLISDDNNNVPDTNYEGKIHTSKSITINSESTKYYVLKVTATLNVYDKYAMFKSSVKITDPSFNVNDINIIAMTIDGSPASSLLSNHYYDLISYACTIEDVNYTQEDNILEYDRINRKLSINDHLSDDLICSLNFTTYQIYYERLLNGASPELYQGLIPVVISSTGVMTVADQYEAWYSYENREWANAVLINNSNTTIKNKYFNSDMSLKSSIVGQEVSMSEVLQMYVWIPRYKYKLWNVNNGNSDPFAIDIVFENNETPKSSGKIGDTFTNGLYYTHPAFTFGTTELNGFWAGKFEPSGTTSNITIKPNLYSLTTQTLGVFFNSTRAIENTYASNYGVNNTEIDTRVMKNMEWGAMAYLTNSIYGRYTSASTCIASGCEVWINNRNTGTGTTTGMQYGPSVTGCSGESVSAPIVSQATSCATNRTWNTNGINASITGNVTGIYDVSGGALEYTMGNMKTSGQLYNIGLSELNEPNSKYYDKYEYGSNSSEHNRGLIGDATKEIMAIYGSSTGGWYEDYAYIPNDTNVWTGRGGYVYHLANSGIFAFTRSSGNVNSGNSFRITLSAS